MGDKNNGPNSISVQRLSNSKINEMSSNNEKFFEDIEKEEEASNNKVSCGLNIERNTNEQDIIENTMEETNNMSDKTDTQKHHDDEEDKFVISSFPNSSSTGLMN